MAYETAFTKFATYMRVPMVVVYLGMALTVGLDLVEMSDGMIVLLCLIAVMDQMVMDKAVWKAYWEDPLAPEGREL